MADEKESIEIISVEEIKDLLAADVLMRPYQLYRINVGNSSRIYFREDNGECKFYLGTTSLGKLLPMSPQLLQWWCNVGWNEGHRRMFERAVHGTYFHRACAQYAKDGGIESIQPLLVGYKEQLVLYRVREELHHKMIDEMGKDILAYMKFCYDYKFKPLGIELALCSDTIGVATLLDGVGDIDDRIVSETTGKVKIIRKRKGETENREHLGEHSGLFDLKTSKSGFFESNILQLEANMFMFRENFHDIKMPERFYNFSPKAWTGEIPTYNFKDQSERMSEERFERLVDDGKKTLQNILEKKTIVFEGGLKFGENPTKLVKKMAIHEIVTSGLWKKYLLSEQIPV